MTIAIVALHIDTVIRATTRLHADQDTDTRTTTLHPPAIVATRLHERRAAAETHETRAVAAIHETASADTDPVDTMMRKRNPMLRP